jgi:HPt (histidine-containing phosphotransfer) domain-containing protein
VCASARDDIQKIDSAMQSEDPGDTVRNLLTKLHHHASAVGFLSLASKAANYNEILKYGPVKWANIVDSLTAELRQAEDKWDEALLRYTKAQKAKALGMQMRANRIGSASSPSCTTAVRR